MVYWKCPGLCTFFFKTSTWYSLCSITQLFRHLGIVEFVSHVNARTVVALMYGVVAALVAILDTGLPSGGSQGRPVGAGPAVPACGGDYP